MVNERRIRERIEQAPPAEWRAIRTDEVVSAVAGIVARQNVVRPSMTLEFQRPPRPVRIGGALVGVDALVRVWDGAIERRVDPHRIIINPPTMVPDGSTHIEFGPDGTPYDASNFREDPLEAFMQAVEQSIVTVPAEHRFGTEGTVTTIFATAPGGNGFALSENATYATARTSGTLSAGTPHSVGQNTGFQCWQSFVIFDTSAIPDDDTVTDVVLGMEGSSDASVTDFEVVAAATVYDGGQVDTLDWVSGDSLAGLTTYATWDSAGYVAGYNAFTTAGPIAPAINKAGNTAMILFSARQRAGTQPSGAEVVTFNDADSAGTTVDPKIDVTHVTLPSQRTANSIRMTRMF